MFSVQTAFFFFAILMFAVTLSQKQLLPSILMAGILISRTFLQLNIFPLRIASAYIEMVFCLYAIGYAAFAPGPRSGIRLALAIVSSFWFFRMLFTILHWPYFNEMRLSMAIPVLVYFISQFRSNLRIQPESGILTFWAACEMYVFGSFVFEYWI
jgi:hypothetical protein